MILKFAYITVTSSLLLFLAACSSADDFDFTQNQNFLKVDVKSVPNTDFKVNEQLLHKFLSIKKEKAEKITPIINDDDTLAYIIDYEKGWKLISGDQRLSPILTQSDNGTFDISDSNCPETASILGQINYIKEIRRSEQKEKSPIWEFLSEKNKRNSKANKIKKRGYGMGMWIPKDTTYDTQTNTYPHIITTSWHQEYPYNQFTPLRYNEDRGIWMHTPVGCVPVAVGQVIYHYRKDCNRNISIPIAATEPTESNTNEFTIIESSTDGWNYLTNSYYVAMFLRNLGQQMHTKYAFGGSGTSVNYMWVMRQLYLLDFDTKEKYDYNTLISYLQKRQPIIISGSSSSGGHRFIIDGYKEIISTLSIRYEWDENHIITEEELNRLPQSLFEQGASGETERIEEITSDKNTYITMNWGWRTDNSNWYLAHEYSSGYAGSDFAGDFNHPQRDYVHPPYWTISGDTYNRVAFMFYNFREYYPTNNEGSEFVP